MTLSSNAWRRTDLATVTLLVLAAALALWPVTVASSAAATAPPALPPLQAAAVTPDAADAAAIVAFNILSSSRRAPTERYVSPDNVPVDDYSLPAAFAATNAAASSDSVSDVSDSANADPVPGLYGIVSMDGVRRALLRLSDDDANPALLREGERRNGYRVVTIRSNAVVVAGPSGPQTLRLVRPARGDSIRDQP